MSAIGTYRTRKDVRPSPLCAPNRTPPTATDLWVHALILPPVIADADIDDEARKDQRHRKLRITLFQNFVGAGQYAGRNLKAKRLGGPEIDLQVELGR